MGTFWGRWSVPCVGDDDVVKGGVATAEARESQFDDHFSWLCGGRRGGGLLGFATMGWGRKMLKVKFRFTGASLQGFEPVLNWLWGCQIWTNQMHRTCGFGSVARGASLVRNTSPGFGGAFIPLDLSLRDVRLTSQPRLFFLAQSRCQTLLDWFLTRNISRCMLFPI